jgi:hypothetical protein
MLAAMPRCRAPRIPLALPLLTLVLAASPRAATAAGLPCLPCAGLRLAAPPAPAGGGGTATAGFDLLTFLRGAHLPPGSPLFVAWDVELSASAQQAAATAEAAGAAGVAARFGPSGGVAAVPPAGGAGSAPDPAAVGVGEAAKAVAGVGATPWITLVFRTPSPLAANAARLQAELAAAAGIAAAAPPGTWFQVAWRPQGGGATAVPAARTGPSTGRAATVGTAAPAAATGNPATAGTAATAPPGAMDTADYAFLLKRAAVAVAGAQAEVHVATAPLPAGREALEAFYGAEVAAYVDITVLAAGSADADGLAAAVRQVHDLDPGRPVALDALPYPGAPPGAVLAEAARRTAAGFDLTLFSDSRPDAAALGPLILLAREFAGDLSADATSAPGGAAESWAFVRGKDLALRVIAVAPAATAAPAAQAPAPPAQAAAPPAQNAAARPAPDLVLHFADPDLRRPTRFPFTGGQVPPPTGRLAAAPATGLDVTVREPGAVVVLGLDHPSAGERHGVAEQLTVASQRDMPVEEILKRLQVFEDGQRRRVESYSAVDTTHLRFQPNAGADSVDVTLAGPLFWNSATGGDWAWESLYVNGVRWRGKTLPSIPLIQPEKAAALPLEILLTREYRYRLRGTGKVAGREAWVVDFAPAGGGGAGQRLYQGTVWIDRQIYARLRTRAVQIGLKGEVMSNEETLDYTPIDTLGRPAPWVPESFVLPLHLVSEQVLSILDNPTMVERETQLTAVAVNPPDFAARRRAVEDSDVTMVRDTPEGLRYLVKKAPGQERVVQEGYARSKLFALAGLFVDDSLNYPLPLGGLDYFSFDFKNTGEQVNVFFAGPLLVASAADPRVGGTRWNAGGDLFAIAVPFTDNLYQNGKEVVNQEVRILPATFDLKVGHPLGDFLTLGVEYGLLETVFSRNSDTSRQFVLPSDNLAQSAQLDATFARGGYTLTGNYSVSMRSSWHAWGLPGNPDFSPADRRFERYDLTATKNWYLSHFQKIAAELDYYSGDHLDRFSKYQFGFFGGTRIHGYRSNDVIATSAYMSHLGYGFDFGSLFRLDALADAAFASDQEEGLHNRLLAGTGLAGSFMGPWQTLVTLDAGVPVAGPDHGFVLYLVFLRLFH